MTTPRHAGYFPVRLEALPEGSVVHAHCPVYQARAGCFAFRCIQAHPPHGAWPHKVTAERPYTGLVTYLETLLTMVWYPTTVATLSRRIRVRT